MRVSVATVDHGLRPEAADEAAFVAGRAAALGLDHEILQWGGWDGQGNLQDRAGRPVWTSCLTGRDAKGCPISALGTRKTIKPRPYLCIWRAGSGVDGLAGMAPARTGADGVIWLRPLLSVPRDALRAELEARSEPWIDDPSNDDLRFDRVRARRLLTELAPLGLECDRLYETAQRMAARALLWGRLQHRRQSGSQASRAGTSCLSATGSLRWPTKRNGVFFPARFAWSLAKPIGHGSLRYGVCSMHFARAARTRSMGVYAAVRAILCVSDASRPRQSRACWHRGSGMGAGGSIARLSLDTKSGRWGNKALVPGPIGGTAASSATPCWPAPRSGRALAFMRRCFSTMCRNARQV